jgi:mannosylglycerate hydrolase MGH1-like protein
METVVRIRADSVVREASRVLEGNWCIGRTSAGQPYSFTAPDIDKFPAQFYWDSCYHAIAWANIDPRRARGELRTLLAAAERDGFIGHTIFWDAPVRLSRRAFYNLLSGRDRMTRTIHPPLLAFGWELVADASQDDLGFRTEALDRLAAHYDWLHAHRDPGDEGLLALIQPDESGLDASPKFDARLRWRAHGLPGFVAFVRRNRRDRFRLEPIRARGGFVVQEVLRNVAYALSTAALARMGPGGPVRGPGRADATGAARPLLGRDRRPLRRSATQRPAGGVDVGCAGAARVPELPAAVAARLIDEHLLDRRRYWRRFPVPSTSVEEPSYRPRTRFPFRYWRGPTWVASSWLLGRGLRLHGRHDAAEELAARVRALVTESGFREYYHPDTGRGQGARAFGMSTLAVAL